MSRTCSKPVWVYSVIRPSFSLPEVEVQSRDFGAYQCASSDGFLVTIIPNRGCGEVIFSYPFSSGKGVIQIRPPDGETPAGPGRVVGTWTPSPYSRTNTLSSILIVSVPSSPPTVPMGSSIAGSLTRRHRFPRRTVRSNVMTPAPHCFGVLEALIPTDEGRIGNGRNTNDKNQY